MGEPFGIVLLLPFSYRFFFLELIIAFVLFHFIFCYFSVFIKPVANFCQELPTSLPHAQTSQLGCFPLKACLLEFSIILPIVDYILLLRISLSSSPIFILMFSFLHSGIAPSPAVSWKRVHGRRFFWYTTCLKMSLFRFHNWFMIWLGIWNSRLESYFH